MVPASLRPRVRKSYIPLLLVLYSGALLYGTLEPFGFALHPGRDSMSGQRQVEWIPFTHLCPIHGILCPTDTGLNILVFIPLGALAALIPRAGTGTMRRAARAGLLGFTLSLLIETTQYFIPARFPGASDIVWNTLGTCLGALLMTALLRIKMSNPGRPR